MDKLDNNSPISNYWNQPDDYKKVLKQEILTIASEKNLFISSFLGDSNLELVPIIWSSLHISKLLKKNKSRKTRNLLKKAKTTKYGNSPSLASFSTINIQLLLTTDNTQVTQNKTRLPKDKLTNSS